jgi:hemolysin activation/secretion protein
VFLVGWGLGNAAVGSAAEDGIVTNSAAPGPALKPRIIMALPERPVFPVASTPEEALEHKIEDMKFDARDARMGARQAAVTNAQPRTNTNGPVFQVKGYDVKGLPITLTNSLEALFTKHTGTNVAMEEILKAAQDLQAAYRVQGHTNVGIALAPKQFSDGVVLFNVFESVSSQIVIGGKRYVAPPPASTNAPPKFPVHAYEITGDTLLTDETLGEILGKYTGTNIGVAEILKAGSELQLEYRDRGYVTVNVTIPPQQITNGIVKIRVFEGELASIVVTNNHYFSSNNVMRAMPGLKTGQILVGPVFQSELDRANANQDRQIYPQLEPGAKENTTDLILDVKDRLPLHGKVEFNNQNSPGTPDMRINSSAAYNDLWQLEHSLGVQYSFSPQEYKQGDQWAFYDRPLVANYSAFYRLPLGVAESLENEIAASPGNFGYDEATRRFRPPSPSGRPELNVYASRSTIDTGLGLTLNQVVSDIATNNERDTLLHQVVQQDLTVNNAIGARLTLPMPASGNFQSAFSAGPDYKTYGLTSYKTNVLIGISIRTNNDGSIHTQAFTNAAPVPPPLGLTAKAVDYLPLSIHYDGVVRDSRGLTGFGLGVSFNSWYTGSQSNFDRIALSPKATGHWVAVTPSLFRDFVFHTNWTLSMRLDGQIASEPLISNEQFGAGGVNSVRGYHEGEVFGDDGWRASIEQKTPAAVIGMLGRNHPLSVRGSVFMDYAETYLLDPLGRPARTPLWGLGAGAVASIGTTWEARLLFAVPLETAGSTEHYHPRFNFALSGQF